MSLEILKLQIKHLVNKQVLTRIPEASEISDGLEQSLDYSKSKDSLMIVPYLVALNLIDRTCEPEKRRKAIELCSGPGNFSELLASVGKFEHVTGVDMSSRMIMLARKNVESTGLESKIQFVQDDVTQLQKISQSQVDLVTFMNGAHHLSNLEKVKSVLTRASELVSSNGVVFVMDPVRPKTTALAKKYVEIFGKDYLVKNLSHFHKDFNDSVFAAWTANELKSAIPKGCKRNWIHILPLGFPAFQFIIGLPEDRKNLWLNKGILTSEIKQLLPTSYRMDFKMLQMSISLGKKTIITDHGKSGIRFQR